MWRDGVELLLILPLIEAWQMVYANIDSGIAITQKFWYSPRDLPRPPPPPAEMVGL